LNCDGGLRAKLACAPAPRSPYWTR
jgi:hypothetical protein